MPLKSPHSNSPPTNPYEKNIFILRVGGWGGAKLRILFKNKLFVKQSENNKIFIIFGTTQFQFISACFLKYFMQISLVLSFKNIISLNIE
jgi:hypothetical protein